MSFDVKCMELAMAFLPADTEQAMVDELAQVIQTAIESYLELQEDVRDKALEKDHEEWIEEMSLGGQTYKPGQSS